MSSFYHLWFVNIFLLAVKGLVKHEAHANKKSGQATKPRTVPR